MYRPLIAQFDATLHFSVVFGHSLPPAKPHRLSVIHSRDHSLLFAVLAIVELGDLGAFIYGHFAFSGESVIQQVVQVHLALAFVISFPASFIVFAVEGADF